MLRDFSDFLFGVLNFGVQVLKLVLLTFLFMLFFFVFLFQFFDLTQHLVLRGFDLGYFFLQFDDLLLHSLTLSFSLCVFIFKFLSISLTLFELLLRLFNLLLD